MPTRALIARHDRRALQGGGGRAWVAVRGKWLRGDRAGRLLGGAEESWVCWRQAAAGSWAVGGTGAPLPPFSMNTINMIIPGRA